MKKEQDEMEKMVRKIVGEELGEIKKQQKEIALVQKDILKLLMEYLEKQSIIGLK